MNTGRPSHLSSKFVTIYTKLFQGLTPEQISPHEDPAHFYSDLLGLDINREFLEGELNRISKDACTGSLKVLACTAFRLNSLAHTCDHPVVGLEWSVFVVSRRGASRCSV